MTKDQSDALEKSREEGYMTVVFKVKDDASMKPIFEAARKRELFCGSKVAAIGWGDYLDEEKRLRDEVEELKKRITAEIIIESTPTAYNPFYEMWEKAKTD